MWLELDVARRIYGTFASTYFQGVFQVCIRSVVLYGSENWAVKEEELVKLDRNDMMMVWWMCNVTLKHKSLLMS